jgi:hypothetical protein
MLASVSKLKLNKKARMFYKTRLCLECAVSRYWEIYIAALTMVKHIWSIRTCVQTPCILQLSNAFDREKHLNEQNSFSLSFRLLYCF